MVLNILLLTFTLAIHLGNKGMLSQYKYIKNVQQIYYGLPLFDRRRQFCPIEQFMKGKRVNLFN